MNQNLFLHDASWYSLSWVFWQLSWQDDDTNPPTISRSGQPVSYALPADKSNIGHGAPSLTDVSTGKKRKLSYTKVITRKKKKSPGQSSAAATSKTDDLANPPSSSEGKVLNSLVISFHLNIEYIFVLWLRCPWGQIWGRRRRVLEHTPSHTVNYSSVHSANVWILPWSWIWHYSSLIPSGAAFAFNSQEI